MRFRVRRLLGVSALALLFGLPLAGCSGQQQQEDGLEVSEQNDDQAGSENAVENTADNQTGDDEEEATIANQEEPSNEESGDTAEVNDGGNENDLQEIIQEMNGQPQDTMAAGGDAQALAPQDQAAMAPAPAPMDYTNTTAAAAVAPAPAATPSSVLPFQPGGTPAADGLPELGSKMAYVVEHGDTLGKISQKIYGTNNRWNELATLSGISNPSRIFPGDLVYYTLDEGAVPFAAAYESMPKSEEQVQPGDTLASIAKRVYGTSTAWRSIWRQNENIENPDIVTGSSVVYIPKGAATSAMNKAKTNLVKLAKISKSTKSTKSNVKNISNTLAKITATNSSIMATSQNFMNSMINIANLSVVPVLI